MGKIHDLIGNESDIMWLVAQCLNGDSTNLPLLRVYVIYNKTKIGVPP